MGPGAVASTVASVLLGAAVFLAAVRDWRAAASRPRRSRGQSEVIGVVLLLGLALAGTTAVVVLGGSALGDTQDRTDLERTGHALTQFDSQAAQVALGRAEVQSVSVGQAGGRYHVDGDAGWLRVTHHNFTGGDDEVIYNQSLGALVYENAETTIVYQGGGVWRRDRNGHSRMVSPPEFHYRAQTLTLPVIRVTGTGGGEGGMTLTVSSIKRAEHVFPNTTAPADGTDEVGPPYNGTEDPYRNPITEGNVTITVKSTYYQAWAEYFRTRTDGNVTVDDANQTVTLELFAVGVVGDFDMPLDDDSMAISGVSGAHSVDNFTVILYDDDDDSASLYDLQWSLWAEEGNQQFEIHLRHRTGKEVKAAVYYSPDGGSTYYGWKNDSAFTIEDGDFDNDGKNESKLVANLTGSHAMEYTKLQSQDLMHFNANGATLADDNATAADEQAAWTEHSGTDVHKNGAATSESVEYTDSDTARMYDVTNHYMALMPKSFDLTVDDYGGNSVNEGDSSGTIDHASSSQFVTYLHITDNDIRVEIS